jgi:uncharacterized protein DUF4190
MQPGYPGSGQDPYSEQQPPYTDPYAQPQYPPPQYSDPYAQPQPPYADPYAQPQPTSGNPYPTSGNPYPTSGNPYPTSCNPYPTSPGYAGPPPYPAAPQYPVAGYGTGYGTGYGAPGGVPQQNNALGLLALILGIVSIPLGFCCSFFGAPFGIAGVVLGILGMKRANEGRANNRGQALAGLICGAAGIVMVILRVALGAFMSFGDITNLS